MFFSASRRWTILCTKINSTIKRFRSLCPPNRHGRSKERPSLREKTRRTLRIKVMSEKTVLPSTTGLRGQSVGSTAVSTVGKEGVGLTYRGYAIEDLAQNASFEEVAYLLIYGALPIDKNWTRSSSDCGRNVNFQTRYRQPLS